MRLPDALRHAARYHLRALPPTAIGLGLAGAGVWYGLDGGTTLASLPASGRFVPTAALVGVGAVVAAVGRTAVRLDSTAGLTAERVADEASLDDDDLRETVALATERAVADSVEGATADVEARVTAAVERAVADGDTEAAGRSPRPSASTPNPAESSAGTDALADATRRASERVESYLATDEADGPGEATVDEFRQLAEGARVLDDSDDAAATRTLVETDGRTPEREAEATPDSGAAEAADVAETPEAVDAAGTAGTAGTTGTAGDGAEILDADPSDPDLPDGGDTDDAEILGDGEMVFGTEVRDPDET
ncbi:hypothetical protein [Halogeometricum limi]|uniref:Uncharacterized protein n=1 Tax=Halogeometricum limi TaxID=555875 RepID=A0A1I6GJJ9_9EURY|nr:hypothetical protein [Halogeometricum limi]SFR42348.1 hypothetical protein SAMN04488124_1140 [Halogeometricum limi]